MDKELVELFEAAKKAADAAAIDGASTKGPNVERCIDALKQLKDFPVSHDVLASTQVAKRLRHLTKHPIEQIQTMASDVVDIWKKIIINEAIRKRNGSSDTKCSTTIEVKKTETVKVEEAHKAGPVKIEKAGTIKVEKIEKHDSKDSGSYMRSNSIKVEKKRGHVETVKAEKTEWSEKVKVEKTAKVEKTVKEDKKVSVMKKPSQASNAPPKLTSMVKCNDAIRDKIRELLVEAFSKVSGEVDEEMKDEASACDPIRVAVAVESMMFEKMGRSNGAQKVKYRSIMFNLKDPNNPDFRRRVLLGHVSPEKLLDLTPEEMASDERQLQNKQIKDKALFDCERGMAPKATTDEFRCGRCGQRKCTYYQLQTRSADEPMTTFVTCVNCNNHWKFC